MHIDAVDSSREMLAEAAKKGVYKRMYCQLLGPTTLPIENGEYNWIKASLFPFIYLFYHRRNVAVYLGLLSYSEISYDYEI